MAGKWFLKTLTHTHECTNAVLCSLHNIGWIYNNLMQWVLFKESAFRHLPCQNYGWRVSKYFISTFLFFQHIVCTVSALRHCQWIVILISYQEFVEVCSSSADFPQILYQAITCPRVHLYSAWLEYSGVQHNVLMKLFFYLDLSLQYMLW